MRVSALILTDLNNAIGKNELIIDYVPAQLRYFKRLTKDSPVLMGRKTFESLGHRLLSKKNIIITRNERYHSSHARTFTSLREALEKCSREKKVFIIGGASILKEALPFTTQIYRSTIMVRFKSEDYYPDIDSDEFVLKSSVCIQRDKENHYDYCIEKWLRNGKAESLKPKK